MHPRSHHLKYNAATKKSSNETSSNIEADEDLRLSNEAVYRGRGRDSDDLLDDDEPDEEDVEEEEEESEDDDDDDEEDEDERGPRRNAIRRGLSGSNGGTGSCDATRNYISDELKYGAGHSRDRDRDLSHHSHSHHNNSHSSHHNHQSLDSNPVESQSEWSDDECREEATGKHPPGKQFHTYPPQFDEFSLF